MLAHFKDKKKDAAAPALPAATMGETVDFESVAVQSLNAQIDILKDTLKETRTRCELVTRQRDANARVIQDAGLRIPDVN